MPTFAPADDGGSPGTRASTPTGAPSTAARAPSAAAGAPPTTSVAPPAPEGPAIGPGGTWRAWAASLPRNRSARAAGAVGRRAARRILPPGPARDAWRGRWLGHALHPLLTDIPIGFWTNASVLDLVGGRRSVPAARRLVGLGVLSAAPTALSGLAELTAADDDSSAIAAVHAAANALGVACYAASYLARRRDRRARGAVLALAGATVATAGGYLGGHLALVRKLGDIDDTRRPATAAGPSQGEARS